MPAGPPSAVCARLLAAASSLEGDESVQLKTLLSNKANRAGFGLIEANKGPILILVNLLTNESHSKEACNFLTLCYNFESLPNGPSEQIFDDAGCKVIEKEVFPKLAEQLKSLRDIQVLECWDVLIKLLGTHIHKRTSLINAGMKVVQSAFKFTDQKIVEKALRSWVVVMENFALKPETLNAPKRVNLLVSALKYTTPKQQESTYRVRLECWYELMYLLGRNLKHHSIVVKEFLLLCFGRDPSEAKNQIASPKSPAEANQFTPNKSMTPVKKFAGLDRFCVDILLQLLAPRPLNPALPKSAVSAKPLPEVGLTPQQFGEMSEIILRVMKDLTDSLKSSNRSEVLKMIVLWEGVNALTCQLARLPNHLDPVLNYLRAVSHISRSIRRQEKLHSFLFDVLGKVTRLPDTVLLSHIFSESAFEKKVSPLFLVISILLQDNILNSKEEIKALLHLLDRVSFKVADHNELVEILQKMEMVSANLTFIGLENLATAWQSLCRSVAGWKELAETKAGAKNFTTILHFLRFPLQCLGERDARFWRDWANLYSLLEAEGDVTVGLDYGQVCADMTERLVTVFMAQEDGRKTHMLTSQVRCLHIMLEKIVFSGLARSLKYKQEEPLGGFKRNLSPLGCVTKTVQHLNKLCDKSLSLGDSELSEMILGAYTTLITRQDQQELVKPLVKLILPNLDQIFKEANLARLDDSGLQDLAYKLLDSLANLLESKLCDCKDTDFLDDMEEFFILCFESKRQKLKSKISEVWTMTFSGLTSDQIPLKLKTVLKKCASPGIKTQMSSSDSLSGELNSFPTSQEFLNNVVISEPAIEAALKGGRKTATPSKTSLASARNSPFKPSAGSSQKSESPGGMKAPSVPRTTKPRLEDEDSNLFVKIQPKPKGKRVLTDHQKDVMTSRHDDIPALFSELSRDDSVIQLPSQFLSQPSFDASNSASTTSNEAILKSLEKKSLDKGSDKKSASSEADKSGSTDVNKSGSSEADKSADLTELTSSSSSAGTVPSQSLLSKTKASELKARKNRRFEPSPKPSGKRKRVSPVRDQSVVKPQRKRTKREEIAREIFGDSSQSEEEGSVKADNISEKEEAPMDTISPPSVEIIEKEKEVPSTIEISSGESNDTPPTTIAKADSGSADADNNAANATISEGGPSKTVKLNRMKAEVSIERLSPKKLVGLTMSSGSHADISSLNIDKLATASELEGPKEPEKGNPQLTGLKLSGGAEQQQEEEDGEEEMIGSSQTETVEESRTPNRRSRRSTAGKARSTLDQPVAQKPSEKAVDDGVARNKYGETSLHQAAKRGDLDKVKELLGQGADPDLKDHAGWYPLHDLAVSSKKDAIKIMKLIIEKGCNIDCMSEESGLTPLQEAVSNGNLKQAQLLLKSGANKDVVCPKSGQTLFQLAESNKATLNLLAKFDIMEDPKTNIGETTVTVEAEPAVDLESEPAGDTAEPDPAEPEPTVIAESQEVESDVSSIVANLDVDFNSQKTSKEVNNDEQGTGDDPEQAEVDLASGNLNSSCDSTNSVESGVTEIDYEGSEDKALNDGPADQQLPQGSEIETAATIAVDHKPMDVNDSSSADAAETTISSSVDSKLMAPKLSPESNKENKSSNSSTSVSSGSAQIKLSALQDKNEKGPVFKSRAAMAVDISRRKSQEARGLVLSEAVSSPSSTTTASPKLIALPSGPAHQPWAKYNPSPSHASPSASILKRRKTAEGTPSSNEGSPLSGKKRHVHFNEQPVSECVEIPRTPTNSAKYTRKKLKLSGPDQDNPFERVYEGTPPLDCSLEPIHPELIGCKKPVKTILLQLAASQTLVRLLDQDLKRDKITSIGDLAALDPASIRNIRGIKPPEDKTVRSVLAKFATNLNKMAPKSPVIDSTSKEEEEKIKEALFNRPSPSPTEQQPLANSPFKAAGPATPERKTVDEAMDVDYEVEEPLAVRAKRKSLCGSPLGVQFLERVETSAEAAEEAATAAAATESDLFAAAAADERTREGLSSAGSEVQSTVSGVLALGGHSTAAEEAEVTAQQEAKLSQSGVEEEPSKPVKEPSGGDKGEKSDSQEPEPVKLSTVAKSASGMSGTSAAIDATNTATTETTAASVQETAATPVTAANPQAAAAGEVATSGRDPTLQNIASLWLTVAKVNASNLDVLTKEDLQAVFQQALQKQNEFSAFLGNIGAALAKKL